MIISRGSLVPYLSSLLYVCFCTRLCKVIDHAGAVVEPTVRTLSNAMPQQILLVNGTDGTRFNGNMFNEARWLLHGVANQLKDRAFPGRVRRRTTTLLYGKDHTRPEFSTALLGHFILHTAPTPGIWTRDSNRLTKSALPCNPYVESIIIFLGLNPPVAS